MNLVSVYMPTKNRVALLQRAVESVLVQTYRNIELIIVSDGSTDGTREYVESIKSDISIKFIDNSISLGACAARNQAINISAGKFITGLDDDDYFMPNRILSFLSEWESNEAKGYKFSCLFDACMINNGSSITRHFDRKIVTVDQIYFENLIGSQIFSKREYLLDSGLYDTNMPAWQDWEFWTRMLDKFGPARNINACSYFVDASHDFERITMNSPVKIITAAKLFYAKTGQSKNLRGIIIALGNYPQVKFSFYDLIMSKNFIFVVRIIKANRLLISFKNSI
jgi:glycosyltransferase involved in cell wall biosynthesis